MDLRAYHNALNQGFSESEASRIGDDARENNRQQPTCDPEPEPDYYDVLVAENTRLLATISRLREALESIAGGEIYPVQVALDALMAEVEGTK